MRAMIEFCYAPVYNSALQHKKVMEEVYAQWYFSGHITGIAENYG
jgi:hypothetical protein